MKSAYATMICGLLSASGPGCAYEVVDSGANEDEGEVGVNAAALGTINGSTFNVHLNDQASETAVSNLDSLSFELTMGFNAKDAPNLMAYTDTTREVFRTASQMAFTTAHISGAIRSTGRLRPPNGWAVIWSDPAITRSRQDPNFVYLTQLAIPNEKFNLSPDGDRIKGSMIVDTIPELCGSFVGGACIARSTDAGRTFSLAAADCIRRQNVDGCPHGVFYDGSDIETSPEGRVYASYLDTNRSKSDVYMATSKTGSFARITNLQQASDGHPRIKIGPSGLYLLVSSGTKLMMARYPAGSSRTATWSTPITVTNLYDDRDVVFSTSKFVRLGPQYDLDIGKSEAGADEVRVVFKAFDTATGRHHIRVNKCTTGATISCSHPGAWETEDLKPNADQFMPAIAYGMSTSGAHAWVITYHDRAIAPSGEEVELVRSKVWETGSNSFIDRTVIESRQIVCPDERGYWGDYDTMAYGVFGMFMRGFTDSSHATCDQQAFRALPQVAALNVSSVN